MRPSLFCLCFLFALIICFQKPKSSKNTICFHSLKISAAHMCEEAYELEGGEPTPSHYVWKFFCISEIFSCCCDSSHIIAYSATQLIHVIHNYMSAGRSASERIIDPSKKWREAKLELKLFLYGSRKYRSKTSFFVFLLRLLSFFLEGENGW